MMHQQLLYNPTLLAKGTVVAVGGAKVAPSLNNGHLEKALNIMICITLLHFIFHNHHLVRFINSPLSQLPFFVMVLDNILYFVLHASEDFIILCLSKQKKTTTHYHDNNHILFKQHKLFITNPTQVMGVF